jgi:hypothetical protein
VVDTKRIIGKNGEQRRRRGQGVADQKKITIAKTKKIWATSVIFKKCPKSTNAYYLGENLPNLVTLLTTSFLSRFPVDRNVQSI